MGLLMGKCEWVYQGGNVNRPIKGDMSTLNRPDNGGMSTGLFMEVRQQVCKWRYVNRAVNGGTSIGLLMGDVNIQQACLPGDVKRHIDGRT